MNDRREKSNPYQVYAMKADIISIGLDTYWRKFDGLLDDLNGYQAKSPAAFRLKLGLVEKPLAMV